MKAMTKEQLQFLIEKEVKDDRCVTEGDMIFLYYLYADDYGTDEYHGNSPLFTLINENRYWTNHRHLFPRNGDKVRGM